MLKRVPTVQTKFAIKDFVKSLSKAWFHIYGKAPTKNQIAVIYSQWGLETGLGTYCWNNNIGNVKAIDIPGQVVEYCVLNNVWEIVNGKKVILKPEDPGSWFRAFPTLDLGVEHHIGFLRNKRYKIAWAAVEQGDPIQFAKLLKKQGYYTAAEADYIRAMQYHFFRFMTDTTFETVQEELVIEFNKLEFPEEYGPVHSSTFNVIDDSFNKKLKSPSSRTVIGELLGKLKTILGKQ